MRTKISDLLVAAFSFGFSIVARNMGQILRFLLMW